MALPLALDPLLNVCVPLNLPPSVRPPEGVRELGAARRSLMRLAMRAAAMTARMQHQALLAASPALGQHVAGQLGAAALHGRQSVELARQRAGSVLTEIVRLEALDQAR